MSNRTNRALQLLVAIAGMVGLFAYGEAHNRGLVPRWGDDLFTAGWLAGMVALAVVYFKVRGRRSFGEEERADARLEPDEGLLFDQNFVSIEFYPNARDLPRTSSLWQWAKRQELSHRTIARISVTNRRIVLSTPLGGVRRSIPVANIEGLAAASGPRFFKSFTLRYRNADTSEALRVLSRRRSRDFVAAVQAVAGEHLHVDEPTPPASRGIRVRAAAYALLALGVSFAVGFILARDTGHLVLLPICIAVGLWIWREAVFYR